MNSVGIDISKGRSTVAVMRPFGEVVISPFEVRHTDRELSSLAMYSANFPIVQILVLFMLGAYLVMSFVIDILYTVLDPRVDLK